MCKSQMLINRVRRIIDVAGYILKIVMENTSPPMWRRVIIPEKITFHDLHIIIQKAFGWENAHLHDFSVPSKNIEIVSKKVDAFGTYNFEEDRTAVDEFLIHNKWVRYTYDFGDDWRHKIIMEKIDNDYMERYAKVLKYKGDNFTEDSGGIYGCSYEEDFDDEYDDTNEWFPQRIREAYDIEKTNQILKRYEVSTYENQGNPMERILKDLELLDKMKRMKVGDGKSLSRKNMREAEQESGLWGQAKEWSLFAGYELERIQNYQDNRSEYSSNFHMLLGNYTILNGLEKLNQAEARAYCKYFQLSVEENETKRDVLIKIRNVFQTNPEYLLYIFYRDELECLLRCYNNVKAKTRLDLVEIYRTELGIQKAILLGILKLQISYYCNKPVVCLYFAEDAECVLKAFTISLKKKYCTRTLKISEMLGHILKTYGVMEIDEIYKVYCRFVNNHLPEKEFKIFLYLHGRFNALYETGANELGQYYVYLNELDHQVILDSRMLYAKGLEYRLFDYEEIKQDSNLYGDFWIEALDEFLVHHLKLEKELAHNIVAETYVNIKNGDGIDSVFSKLKIRISQWNHYESYELWLMVLSLIKEMNLPMLKGYSRDIVADMREENWWDYKILEQEYTQSYQDKDKPLYEFPAEIQAKLYDASEYDSMEYASELHEYMVANQVQSEEYIYLLAFVFASNSEYKLAEKLARQLRKSSSDGEQLAERVEERIQNCSDIDDFQESIIKKHTNEMMLDHILDMEYGNYNQTTFQHLTPYVREEAKIGRNDRCPCGSGKKYKKCCGSNKV